MRPNTRGHRGGGRGRGNGGRGRGGFRGRGGGGGGFGGKRNFNDSNDRPRPARSTSEHRQMNNLKEVDVGITEFVGTTAPFTGIIKQKYSDFQVNEIDMEGNVVTLTDLSIPKPPKDDYTKLVEDKSPELEGLVTDAQWEEIAKMIETNNKSLSVLVDVTEMTKENRTKIHTLFKSKFTHAINSFTVDQDDKKFIKVALTTTKSDKRTKWLWPHDYTYFVLHKYNTDTMKACSDMAFGLRMKPSKIAYAGTKDKRAHTSQLMCIKRKEPVVILNAVRKIPNMYCGNFSFKQDTLKLGHLQGNQFRIALRRITAEREVVEESLKSVKENGCINYYGLQRFGNSAEIPTYAIGRALIQGKWLDAVELILKPRKGETEAMHNVRKFWMETKDAAGALRMLDRGNTGVEAKLLQGLAKHNENDLVNALEMIPRNMRLLYLHSYQSLLWNKAASRRIQLGLKPIVGDLVFVDKEQQKVVETATEEAERDDEQDGEGDEEGEEKEDKAAEDAEKVEEVKVDWKSLVKPLTQSDIDSGDYSLADVVLPLVGHDIAYPSNEIGDYYKEMLAEDGLTSEELKQRVKTYSITGAYRNMFMKPENLSWEIVKYDSDQQMLLNTDFEFIKKDRLITLPENGQFTAVLLKFCLKSSSYATMVLREILKIDTSTQHQIDLAKAGEEQDKKEAVKVEEEKKEDVAVVDEEEPQVKKAKLEEETIGIEPETVSME